MQLLKSKHAQVRMSQRSIQDVDVAYIMSHGSNIDDNTVMITNNDFNILEAELKSELKRLERLRNKKLVHAENIIITTYHSRLSDQKKAMKRRKESF